MPSLYYNHSVDYVIILWLLCDKNIDRNGILQAYELIDEYIKNFEILYGKENMNLHSHINLPSQELKKYFFQSNTNKLKCPVFKFCQLISLSAFAFQGMFKFCGSLLHGTRGSGIQIGHHLREKISLTFKLIHYF